MPKIVDSNFNPENNENKFAKSDVNENNLGNSATDELLENTQISSSTLDYLKENNILVSQKQYDETAQNWIDGGEPIASQGSIYQLVETNAEDYDFSYNLIDDSGQNLTKYYNFNLKDITNSNFETLEYPVNITWQEVSSAVSNTIDVELNNAIKHYSYTYLQPENYQEAESRINDNLLNANTEKVVFKNFTNYLGGAISNNSDNKDKNIVADFINNSASLDSGGAIRNYEGSIGNITGNFIGNTSYHYGGAIYNYKSHIGNITGNFINNVAQYGNAGAIDNDGYIGNITGNFIGNISQDNFGGAIYNPGTIGNITGDFVGNKASDGGAIFANGTIGNITGDFIANQAKKGDGGAIKNNEGNIETITSNFINNSAFGNGGAINNYGKIKKIYSNFIGNFSQNYSGGAIYNHGNIENLSANFIDNSAISGGALFVSGNIGNITGDFILNKSKSGNGGAINTNGCNIESINANFVNNSASGYFKIAGGAISNNGNIKNIVNSNFINNKAIALGENAIAHGGAIHSQSNLKITADNGESIFTGNTTISDGKVDNEAIYIETPEQNSSKLELSMEAINNGAIILDDKVNGSQEYDFALSGDSTGKIVFNDTISNANISLTGTNLYLKKENLIDNNNLTLNSGNIHLINGQTGIVAVNNLTVTRDTNVVVDVDLANKEMDRFTANNYGNHQGNLNVGGMNLLSDAKEVKTEIMFAQEGLKNNVTTDLSQVPDSVNQLTAYTPIYKYRVSYENRNDAGYFIFDRGSASSGNSSDNFNPSVLATPSAVVQAGAMSTINQTFNYAFQNSDNFMNIPYLERISMKNKNRYALSVAGDATNVGTFSPLFMEADTSSIWVKPYASFESIPLKNGPKVSNNTYGTLFGYDTNLIPMKHGWEKVWTGYIGYNGASQHYSGVNSTQNGGLLGGTLTLYKGNFFNATTISAGANVASNSTMYGHENLTMLLAGVGNKTGYNLEVKEGKLIFQPNMLISYTFVNTFDYTNAAGVKIKTDSLHAIQLAPGLKVIGNTKTGWQPFASVNMVWNLMGKTDAMANDVRLPSMSVKPYIQYGVGVQKRFKDNITAYGQAMIQHGGRNGIALTGGFRWALGQDGKPIDKVHNNKYSPVKAIRNSLTIAKNESDKLADLQKSQVQSKRTIIKQLSANQKAALNYKNTTRTISKTGIIKML